MNNGNIEYSYAVSKEAPSPVTYQLTPINATTLAEEPRPSL